MFEKQFKERLSEWKQFRDMLETSNDPLSKTVEFYSSAPFVTIQADPWDQSTWPGPWELLEDNLYCPFIKILAICYTLQLTNRFSQSQFEIHITQDNNNIRYLLTVDNMFIGYDLDGCRVNEIPNEIIYKKTYNMRPLQ